MTLLKAITGDPPPLVPETAIASARAAYDQLFRQPPSYANAIEDAIIAYGRVLWPYRKAFEVFVRNELGATADVHARAPGTTRPETLAATCDQLVAQRTEAERVVRTMIERDPAEYRRLIREFQALQHEIEQHLAGLRRLAERAADHPEVFSEIVETGRMFERGLARLAKEPTPKEACAAIEAYRERHERSRTRREVEARPRIF